VTDSPSLDTKPLPQGQHYTYTVTSQDIPTRLDRFLVQRDELENSRSFIKKLITQGHVTRGGNSTKPSEKLKAGDQIEVYVPVPTTMSAAPEDIPLQIHFEDEHLIVVEKPVGMVVHPAPGHPNGTLVNALLHHCQDLSGIGGTLRPGIVHRLDRDTSGVMVAAKHDRAHQGLAALFKEKPKDRILRLYKAIIRGTFDEDTLRIETPYGRHPTQRLQYSSRFDSDKHAITHVRVLERHRFVSLIECRLETGRTHQIRVHMADRNRHLIGDQLYTSKAPSEWPNILKKFPRQALHAYTLRFEHPITKEMIHCTSPLPTDMQNLLDEINKIP